jgi:predicted CoA-substrate-specific enzyme activase
MLYSIRNSNTDTGSSMINVGLDIGSTTVKAVAVTDSYHLIWKKYERHQSKQTEKILTFLEEVTQRFGIPFRLFTTGSGGKRISESAGVRYFQEVNALSYAAERLHPDIGSIFEIGGQDAKFILWRGKKGKFSTMNDRCAGGTGATIDRIIRKLNLSERAVSELSYSRQKVYPVAGKCGVFAETDINSLQKRGIPEDSLLISLFQSIVEQNLAVLVRGYTPQPKVLLLGGPNAFFPALREAWKYRIHELWEERKIPFGQKSEDILAPEDGLYYNAYGAVLLGLQELQKYDVVENDAVLRDAIRDDKSLARTLKKEPFFPSVEEKAGFVEQYRKTASAPYPLRSDETSYVCFGIDGGSTSTKGVVLDSREEVVCSAYKLSEGNPLTDARDILEMLKKKTDDLGLQIIIKGLGVTGYAKDLLSQAFGADAAIVETVAHTLGTLKYFPDADVICDVGGQDIKVILLNEGTVKDFRLNTQCSAGNGYYLQATAERFGYRVDEFAEAAFRAEYIPSFNFGCAVFMESDIVNFQQLGWKPYEIMAGLARILPLNIWLYVVQEPNLSRLGKVFILQGGTHNNLAVIKAQVDFIRSRVKDAKILVHPYNEVAGAIGAALEAKRKTAEKSSSDKTDAQESRFIGFHNLRNIHYSAKRDEETRCTFCKNRCLRTFVTIHTGDISRTYIIASCEKGQAQNRNDLKKILQEMAQQRHHAVNFVNISNVEAFRSYSPPVVNCNKKRHILKKVNSLQNAVIGIPRVLNIYSAAPLLRAYFESLGVKKVVFSDFTSETLYKKTAGRGSIDPCFPSKVAISHVYDLIYNKNISHLFFPCIRMLRAEIDTPLPHWACPVVAATPEVVKAAFSLEHDEFQKNGIIYLDPVLDLGEPDVLEKQLYAAVKEQFPVRRKEHRDALQAAFHIWDAYFFNLQKKAEKALVELEKEGGIGIVFLGRPYHNDPGINHGILDELNKFGYPIFTVESLPKKGRVVEKVFGNISSPLDVTEVWPRCYSENTSLKIWAARFAARHENLIALDFSSFRCGHDAPLYSVIDDIFNETNSPYFTFHEIDENKPLGSIKLRVETIDYFLRRMKEEAIRCQKSSLAV